MKQSTDTATSQMDLKKVMLSETSQTAHTAWFHLFEILEQAKITCDRYLLLWGRLTEKGHKET